MAVTEPDPARPVPTTAEDRAWQLMAEHRGSVALAELDAGIACLADRLAQHVESRRDRPPSGNPADLAKLLVEVVSLVRQRREWTARRARLLDLMEPGTDHTPPEEPPVVDEVRTLALAAWDPDALARTLRAFCDQRRAELELRLPKIERRIGHARSPLPPGHRLTASAITSTVHPWHEKYLAEFTPLLAEQRDLENRIALLAGDEEGIARAAADAAIKAVLDAGGPETIVKARIDQLKVSGEFFRDDELRAAREQLAQIDAHMERLGDASDSPYAAELGEARPTAEARVKELESAVEARRTAEAEDLVARVMAGEESGRVELARAVGSGARTYPRGFAPALLAAAFTEVSPLAAALAEVELEAAAELARLKAGLVG